MKRIHEAVARSLRSAFFAATVAAGVLSLFGCRVEHAGPGTASEQVELTYWPAPNQQEVELADTLVRRWNALHPDIHVSMQPIPVSQSTEEVLLAAIAGKTTPDICSNMQPAAMAEYAQAGGIIALDQFPDFDSVASGRTPRELLETFRSHDGHWYQLPWKTNPVMMFYNRRLFAEAGVTTVPRTYSEFLAAGAKVTRDVDGDSLLLVNRKANNYPWMGRHAVAFTWHDGVLGEVSERPYSLALADRIAEVLADGPLTVAEIADELKAEGEAEKADTVSKTLRRHRDRFTLEGDRWMA